MTRRPVWKQQERLTDIASESIREGLLAWFKTNKAIISIISAFIVLASFWLKGSVEDTGKNLEDAAQVLEANATREQDKEHLLEVLKTIVSETDTAIAPKGRDRKRYIEGDVVLRAYERAVLSSDRASSYCSILSGYKIRFPEYAKEKDDFNQLCEKRRTLYRESTAALIDAFNETRDSAIAKKYDDEWHGLLYELQLETQTVALRLRAGSELKHSQSELSKSESNMLFVLGWLIGLLANISGVGREMPGASEE